jgi:hypothetical protein
MNPGAQSFSPTSGPGQKRPRDDAQPGAQQGNAGKRLRGGGPQA